MYGLFSFPLFNFFATLIFPSSVFLLIVKFASSLSGNYFFFPQEKAGKRTNTIRNFARPTKTFSQSFGLGLRRKKGKARKAPKLNFSACGKKARFFEKEGEEKGRGRWKIELFLFLLKNDRLFRPSSFFFRERGEKRGIGKVPCGKVESEISFSPASYGEENLREEQELLSLIFFLRQFFHFFL